MTVYVVRALCLHPNGWLGAGTATACLQDTHAWCLFTLRECACGRRSVSSESLRQTRTSPIGANVPTQEPPTPLAPGWPFS